MKHLGIILPIAVALLALGCDKQGVKDTLSNREQTIKVRSSILYPFGLNRVVDYSGTEKADYRLHIMLTGAKWCRETVNWEDVQPEFLTWRWNRPDRVLAEAKDYGLRLLMTLNRSATWSVSALDAPRETKLISPPNPVHWGRYVRTMVEHCRSDVQFWEIWNRPDSALSFDGRPEQFVEMLKAAYGVAREADPDCVVLMGTVRDPEWLDSALVFGAGKYCDVFCVDLSGVETTMASGTGTAPKAFDEAPLLQAARFQMQKFVNVLRERRVDKPVWVTCPGTYAAPAEDQARLVVKLHATLLASGADMIFWDSLISDRDGSVAAGLFYPDLSRRPAGEAYAGLTGLLGQARYSRIISCDPVGVTAYEFRQGSAFLTIAWSVRDAVIKLPEGCRQAYDMYGRVRILKGEELSSREVKIGREPVFFAGKVIGSDRKGYGGL